MVKDVLDTLLLHVEFGDKLVTTPQGSLESHIDTCHYRVYPLLVQSGKADAGTQQKLMARMLQIMLIIGIIDDALQVAQHERRVSKMIDELVDVASAEKDKATQDFLWGFVREQVEEEATADGIVDMIKKAGDAGIFFVDSKLGERR